ncbi:MAG: outer membrane beta-barrel protein [Saprospiraceae bacterium]|nr:outer membrane beta-barrel protein [Saprospiraceae bacterium]
MLKNILVVIFSFSLIDAIGQSEKGTIKGMVKDTSNEVLSLASVMLLDPVDSTLLEYTQADVSGFFEINSVPYRSYLLKINYVSYIPFQKLIELNKKELNLGELIMQPIAKQLFEVVIKAAKAPMSIKGDTIEYDASTFKVPQGSTVEDLLRKLPGMEVDIQGNITSEGKNVNKVTVDGKTFFGGDPKAATKNLPAEGIKKVQVFSDQSEEEKITGHRRLNADKAMNLELKDEFKNGGFGKVIVGAGTEFTKELKMSYNKFSNKHQFAFLGSGTNTGRNGLSWNDYQDFKGSNSFNWGDDGEFGFGSGSNFRMTTFDDGGDDDDNSGIGGFFGGDNFGFPEKVSTGINYNYDYKKTKLSSMYFYDLNNLYSDAYRTQNFLYYENPYDTQDTSSRSNRRQSHRLELRYEQDIDSLSGFIVKSNHSIGIRNTLTNTNTHSFTTSALAINDQLANIDVNGLNVNSQNSIIFKRKFKKQGRNLGVSGAYNYNNSDRDSDQDATSNFYSTTGAIDSTIILNQIFSTNQPVNTFKANAFWMEPLGKRLYYKTFYNFARALTNYERNVSDSTDQNQLVANDFLSRKFSNVNGYNRLGQSLNYIHSGFNINIGLAYQEIFLTSEFKTGIDSAFTVSKNVYQDWIPNAEVEYEMSNGSEFSISYSKFVTAPPSRDLLPILDNSNPLFIRIGNPDLRPEVGHDVGFSFRKFNRLNFTSLFSRFGVTYNKSDIINLIDINQSRVSISTPINVEGTKSIYANINFGFPIVKNRYTLNLGYNYNYSYFTTLVNSISNNPVTQTHGFSLRSNITPSEIFTLFISGNYRIQYQQTDPDSLISTKVYNYGVNSEMNIKFPKLFFFNSSVNVNTTRNPINDFNITIPIINISVSKLFLKDNKGEIRLSGYDILNKTQGIQNSISSNRINQTQTLSLARYLMLSFTYNMRGIKSSLDRGGRRGMFF